MQMTEAGSTLQVGGLCELFTIVMQKLVIIHTILYRIEASSLLSETRCDLYKRILSLNFPFRSYFIIIKFVVVFGHHLIICSI